MTEAELWERWGPEMRAELAKAPALSPSQIRAIRAIWLSVLTARIPTDRGSAMPRDRA